MKTVLTSLFMLLLSASMLAQSQNVSGRISGPDGMIPNVSVREVDEKHRIYNHTVADKNGLFSFRVRDMKHHLQFYAPGYRKLTHSMLGYKLFNVKLEPKRVSPYIGKERLVLKSDRLFCGIYMGTDVKQMAWIEQMNDTLYTLILPVKMDYITDEYPVGRMLLVLTDLDQPLMEWENVMDAYPVDLAPYEVSDYHLAQTYSDIDYKPGVMKEGKPLYAYPHFQFTKANLEYIVQHPNALRRLAMDTYKADNYWNLYPTEQTIELLKQVLQTSKK